MIYTFRVLSSRASLVRMGLRKNDIVNDIVTEAEKLDLGDKDHALFDHHALKLKIVVQFARREIHVMTAQEAKKAKLPGSV
jgi:hypothetical protein